MNTKSSITPRTFISVMNEQLKIQRGPFQQSMKTFADDIRALTNDDRLWYARALEAEGFAIQPDSVIRAATLL